MTGDRRVEQHLRLVRLSRAARVRTCQLRLQVGSDKDINCIFAENDPDDMLYREEKIVMSDSGSWYWYAYFSDNLVVSSLGVFSCLLQIAVFI